MRLFVFLSLVHLVIAVIAFPLEADAKKVTSLCRINHPSDSMVEWECRKVKKAESLESLFGERWKDVARFNRVDRRHVYPGISIKVPKRRENATPGLRSRQSPPYGTDACTS